MNAYSIALFLHIVGALGFFVALGLEWTGLQQLRSAGVPEQVRAWMGILRSTIKVGFPSMLATVLTGFYMVLTAWGWVPWILVVLGTLVLVIAFSAAVSNPRMKAMGQALAEKGPLSHTFRDLVNSPLLWISIQARVALALGIIYLKIAKPDLAGSLLVIGVALLLGLASALALPALRRMRAQAASAD